MDDCEALRQSDLINRNKQKDSGHYQLDAQLIKVHLILPVKYILDALVTQVRMGVFIVSLKPEFTTPRLDNRRSR